MKTDADVRVFEIPGFFQWGTPNDLQNFEFWERSYQAYIAGVGKDTEVDQVLMPMAGLGSRFRDITPVLKPLIPVNGTPMFMSALRTLPSAKHNIFVTIESVASDVRKAAGLDSKIVALSETPSGQALSVKAGLSKLEEQGDLIVSSCDHGIVVDPGVWRQFRSDPDCDAAIFTIQGYPGVNRHPTAFSYVVTDASVTGTCSVVNHVAVKEQVSERPMKDHLLVGTFWFKNKRVLEMWLAELLRRDSRVNDELYLDSVFDCLIQMGRKVRIIPLAGYLCWGDPDSLAEALYWQEIFTGHKIEMRSRFPGVPPV
jgi:NDP-sugar pyrophosphorylase family protein